MIKVGIIGGTGYVAGELIRCLVHHPEVEIDFVYSHSKAGVKANTVHQDLVGLDVTFTGEISTNVDVIFLCLGHGKSKTYIQSSNLSNAKIIDLSTDYRWDTKATYGLPELLKADIKNSNFIGNPGCFATAIQLALLPLASKGLLSDDIHVNATTGSTGAGRSFSDTSHFSWRESNLSVYKAFSHQHLTEINTSIKHLQDSFDSKIHFLSMRGGFTRGILANCYTKTNTDFKELKDLYTEYYQDAPFVHTSTDTVHLKQVVNTNQCLVQLIDIEGMVLITSVIDNLLKGAAGTAIHNMNLMFGLEETTGLNFKANYF